MQLPDVSERPSCPRTSLGMLSVCIPPSVTENILILGGLQVPVFNADAITWYVQHPVPIEPPAEEQPPAAMPLMLTKKVCPACCCHLEGLNMRCWSASGLLPQSAP